MAYNEACSTVIELWRIDLRIDKMTILPRCGTSRAQYC